MYISRRWKHKEAIQHAVHYTLYNILDTFLIKIDNLLLVCLIIFFPGRLRRLTKTCSNRWGKLSKVKFTKVENNVLFFCTCIHLVSVHLDNDNQWSHLDSDLCLLNLSVEPFNVKWCIDMKKYKLSKTTYSTMRTTWNLAQHSFEFFNKTFTFSIELPSKLLILTTSLDKYILEICDMCLNFQIIISSRLQWLPSALWNLPLHHRPSNSQQVFSSSNK